METKEEENLQLLKVEEEEAAFTQKETLEDELNKCWIRFAEKLKAEGRDSEFTLVSQPKTFENNLITLEIHNSLQESMFDGLKAELMEALRTQLSNKSLEITTKKVEVIKDYKPYTAQEKTDYFSKKNPAFKELVNRLGLDAEF